MANRIWVIVRDDGQYWSRNDRWLTWAAPSAEYTDKQKYVFGSPIVGKWQVLRVEDSGSKRRAA